MNDFDQVKKKFRSKKILGKNFWVKKIFGQKDLGPNFLLSKKQQVGLIQGGGHITPPPENSRVKIVLGCC